MSTDVNALLLSAQDDGMSGQAIQILSSDDISGQMHAAMGIDPDDMMMSELVLVSILVDNTISIAPFVDSIRDGHNLIIESLASTKQKDGIMIFCVDMDGHTIYPYRMAENAEKLTTVNYAPTRGNTPLFDATLKMLAAIAAKTQQALDNGISTRSISLIMTDGGDNSSRHSAHDVATVVADMLPNDHIVAAMGIGSYASSFNQVFADMGIPPEWVLPPGSTQSDIRKAFALFSQSAVSVSQSAGAMTTGGGFA